MIRRFRHKGLERLYAGDRKGVPAALAPKLRRILAALDEAAEPDDMNVAPGWRLHPLKGELAGYWAVSASGNWRVIFRFAEGEATDVDLVDYH